MKNIPCIEWYARKTKTENDLNVLAGISVANHITCQKISEYSQLLAHSYAIYDNLGYETTEIETYVSQMDKRKNFCSAHYKGNNGSVCETCEHSKNFLGHRTHMECTVLYYLLDNNGECSQYQGAEKNMFVSKKIIKKSGDVGTWPIIEFYKEIYNFIFINFFSGVSVNSQNFYKLFMGYINTSIPLLAKECGQSPDVLRDAFSNISQIFISSYRKISDSEYAEALQQIRIPYKEYIKTMKTKAAPEPDKKVFSKKPSAVPREKNAVVDDNVLADLKGNMEEFLHIGTASAINNRQIIPDEKNTVHPNSVPKKMKDLPKVVSSATDTSQKDVTVPASKPASLPDTTITDNGTPSISATENVLTPTTSPAMECVPEETALVNKDIFVPEKSASIFLLKKSDVKVINDNIISELIIKVIRSGIVVLELGKLDSMIGVAIYPAYSGSVYFCDKRHIECLKLLLKQLPPAASVISYDTLPLLCYMRKYSVRFSKTLHFVSLRNLYQTKQKITDCSIYDMIEGIIGKNISILNVYECMLAEQRVYTALWERLMTSEEISAAESREFVNKSKSFSFHFSEDKEDIEAVKTYHQQHNITCPKIKIEIPNMNVWKSCISKVISRMYLAGVFESFHMHIDEWKDTSFVLSYLSPYKDDLIDTMWHIFGSSISKKDTAFKLSIKEYSSEEK